MERKKEELFESTAKFDSSLTSSDLSSVEARFESTAKFDSSLTVMTSGIMTSRLRVLLNSILLLQY